MSNQKAGAIFERALAKTNYVDVASESVKNDILE
jgi:hypothetical protein